MPADPIVDLFADVIGSKAVELQNLSLKAIAPERFTVGFSEFNAFEVHGPGADVLLRLSQLGTLAVVVGLAVLWVRAWRPSVSRRPARISPSSRAPVPPSRSSIY